MCGKFDEEGFCFTISHTLLLPSPGMSSLLSEQTFTDKIKTPKNQQAGRSRKKIGSTEHPISVWRHAESAGHSVLVAIKCSPGCDGKTTHRPFVFQAFPLADTKS